MSDPKIPEIESVANELKKRPPAVLDRLGLVRCRAFMHQRNVGLKVSSNNGAVTVDVWMTLDEYNVPNQSPCSSVTSESSRRRKAYDDDQALARGDPYSGSAAWRNLAVPELLRVHSRLHSLGT
jgi:hypothetical protein